MKREAVGHTKMKKLCRKLQIPTYQGIGILEALWHLTAREAQRGDIGKLSNEDIALGIDYRGDPDELVTALIDCEWLEVHQIHRLLIHDWAEHADDAVKKRVARSGIGFCNPDVRFGGQRRTTADNGGHVSPSADNGSLEGKNGGLAVKSGSLPEPEPVPVPEPVPGAAVIPFRKIKGIEPSTWEYFRSEYERSGLPLNEFDWVSAMQELAQTDVDDLTMRDKVIPALQAVLPEWIETKDKKYIKLPKNWIKERAWTRASKARDSPAAYQGTVYVEAPIPKEAR